nr:hypothetical protein Iba_chr14aCG26190 [Ipomoea batatas]GMD85631.1 hypothetical protein Iba_chr14aCG26220 [Ipomoea batatas]
MIPCLILFPRICLIVWRTAKKHFLRHCVWEAPMKQLGACYAGVVKVPWISSLVAWDYIGQMIFLEL